MVENLPPDAATWRGGDPWTTSDHLLASIADLVAVGHQIKTKSGQVFSIPRPDENSEPEQRTAADTMRELMVEG